MIRSLYNTGMGMLVLQKQQETVSNNLANVETPSYKSRELLMEAAFSETLVNHAQGRRNVLGSLNLGTRVGGLHTDLDQGVLTATGSSLDVALQGTGFFQIQTPDGQVLSRNGRFHLSENGVLVDEGNNPVLAIDGTGDLVPVPVESPEGLSIGADGALTGSDGAAYRLSLVDVTDPGELVSLDDGYFGTGIGNLEPAAGTVVRQGFYERSNVDVTDGLIRLMNNTAMMGANGRVLTTLDETLSRAVNEIGKL